MYAPPLSQTVVRGWYILYISVYVMITPPTSHIPWTHHVTLQAGRHSQWSSTLEARVTRSRRHTVEL